MTSRLWRMYADHLYYKWEKTVVWDMIEPYRRPRSFTPLVSIYVAAFYTGVIGSAITEQLYKEKYWEEHPGEVVPLMEPKFYWGPWKVMKGEVPTFNKEKLNKSGSEKQPPQEPMLGLAGLKKNREKLEP